MLRAMLEADLARAQRLFYEVQPDPIDPQFRIATPEGDYWIALTLTDNAEERAKRLALVSDFMAWKLSPGFTLATELREPDCILVAGVLHNDVLGLLSRYARASPFFPHRKELPKWLDQKSTKASRASAITFASPPRWLSQAELGDEIPALLPRGSRTITTAKEQELVQWFGLKGKFPAVLLRPNGKLPR
jgi:hypothetical protein